MHNDPEEEKNAGGEVQMTGSSVEPRNGISIEWLWRLLVIQVGVISISIAASSLAFGLSLCFVLYLTATERRWLFHRTTLDYFFLAYVVVELVTTALAVYPAQAFLNTKRLLLISIVYLVPLAFDSRMRIVNGLLAIVGIVAALSVVEVGYYYLEQESRLMIFQHYMTTGGLKMIVCLITLPFVLDSRTPSYFRKWAAGFFVPIFIALLLTNTRSSWVGFVGGFVVFSFLKSKKLFLALLALIVLFFLLAPTQQVQRAKSIVNIADRTNHSRLVMWSTGLKIFADHPLLGVGDSDLHEIYVNYRSPDDPEGGGHLHNNYVHLLVTLGSVGLAVVLAMFIRILVLEYKIFAKVHEDWLFGSVALGAAGVFVGFLLNGVFEWNFGDHEIMVFVWFTVGLAIAADGLWVKERA